MGSRAARAESTSRNGQPLALAASSRPDADNDARAWNPPVTCQGCRLSTHRSLVRAQSDQKSALTRFADSCRTFRKGREVPEPDDYSAANSTPIRSARQRATALS